jgi:hypothetical protein
MDKRIDRINCLYTKFLNAVNTQLIPSYYNISNEFNITLNRTKVDEFVLYIKYENIPPLIRQLQLPSDILNYIKSFLHKKISIDASFSYSTQYPFRPPLWSILNSSIDLKKEIAIFNRSLDDAWLPCMTLEHDVLCYLVWAIQMCN